MGEHHPAASNADGIGAGGYVADKDFRAGSGEVGDAVVLGQPVPLISQLLDRRRQFDGVSQASPAVSPSRTGD